jgi:hypothetical protein
MGTQEPDPRKDIAARLEKAIVELKELEAAIKFIGPNINPLLLTDFRDATDHIRVTAWTMQSWLEQHGKEGSEYPFLPMLTQERVRRATQLCEDLAADLEPMELTPETEGIEKFEKLHRWNAYPVPWHHSSENSRQALSPVHGRLHLTA